MHDKEVSFIAVLRASVKAKNKDSTESKMLTVLSFCYPAIRQGTTEISLDDILRIQDRRSLQFPDVTEALFFQITVYHRRSFVAS